MIRDDDTHLQDDTRLQEVMASLHESYVRELTESFDSYMTDATSGISSPIEQMMAVSLVFCLETVACFGEFGYDNCFCYGTPSPTFEEFAKEGPPSCHGIEVRPQVPVGRYCADFLVRFAHWRGGYVFGAIECDGHDHHNLTKAQAQRDRERDRYFQKLGIIILRYTGSEVWQNPLKAAFGALTILESRAAEQTAARWGKR